MAVVNNCTQCSECCPPKVSAVERNSNLVEFVLTGCPLFSWQVVDVVGDDGIGGVVSTGAQGVVVGQSYYDSVNELWPNSVTVDLTGMQLNLRITVCVVYTRTDGVVCGPFCTPFFDLDAAGGT